MQAVQLNATFPDLKQPQTFVDHIQDLQKLENAIPHELLLVELLKQFEPIDFLSLAFPEIKRLEKEIEKLEAELIGEHGKLIDDPAKQERLKYLNKRIDKFKLNEKHYLVLSIEQILKVAEKNKWGLCKNHDFIYLYNGANWCEVVKEAFQKFLGEATEKLGVPKFKAKYFEFRTKLFKQFLALAYLPSPSNDLDTVLINLLNGTFEVNGDRTKIRPFNPDDFLTYQLPFAYDPQATAPIFQRYLDRCLPDETKQKVLAEFLGLVFIKNGSKFLKEEKSLVLYGTGANGKSVFFEVVSALLGENNTSNYSLQSITDSKGYQRAKLTNKLVNYASEINGKLERSILKQLASGEPVEARLPYGQPFIMKQYARLIFNCNDLPKDVEHTNAYFRRFLIIPFEETIPEHEQDKQLHTKIIESELSGVFNWVLHGLKRLLLQKRFTHCEAVQKAVEQYKTESDSVKMFVSECGYSVSSAEYIILKELYGNYRSFCIDDGYKPVNKRNFKKRLESFGIPTDRKNVGNVVWVKCENSNF